jgi:hypothetical protein
MASLAAVKQLPCSQVSLTILDNDTNATKKVSCLPDTINKEIKMKKPK